MHKTTLEQWLSEKLGISEPPDTAHLRDYQLRKLRETVSLVKEKNRFYSEQLRAVRPEDLTTLSELALLPFTTPAQLQEAPTDFLCVSPREISRIVTLSTSGTTGSPKRLFFTEADQELTADFFHRGMMTLTAPGDRVMIFMPGSTPGSVGELLSKGLRRFGAEPVVYGPIRDYADAFKALVEQRITALVGIPSQILALSRTPGVDQGKLRLKSVLLSADYVPHSVSRWLEQLWGTQVYGHYGMTETGLGGGVACEAREGYHLREADLLFEVINPQTGASVPDGVYGEVVFTTLTRQGMPLIRYRTGDSARFLTEPCPCGTVLRRLDHVRGRMAAEAQLRGGAVLALWELDEIIYADKTILSYEAALVDSPAGDCLRLTVYTADGRVDTKGLTEQLTGHIKSIVSSGLHVAISPGTPDFYTTGTLKRSLKDYREHRPDRS